MSSTVRARLASSSSWLGFSSVATRFVECLIDGGLGEVLKNGSSTFRVGGAHSLEMPAVRLGALARSI